MEEAVLGFHELDGFTLGEVLVQTLNLRYEVRLCMMGMVSSFFREFSHERNLIFAYLHSQLVYFGC